MSTAHIQGRLWGARARQYADLVEGFFCPAYERVFAEAGVRAGTRLLDVACGPGLAASLAARRGATVAGADAAERSIAIARERCPQGDFRIADMEALPWPAASFDVVTSFNGFQFAADLRRALREARRVIRRGGRVSMLMWGRDDQCDVPQVIGALRELLPPQPSSPSLPLATPGRIEGLMEETGMTPIRSGEVAVSFAFADLGAAVGGLLSAGAAVAVIERVGAEPVHQALTAALTSFRTEGGGYVLNNTFRFVIASAS